MSALKPPPKQKKPKRPQKRPLRKLVEFKGVSSWTLDRYRNSVRELYDGPAGAVLAIGSFISMHEPLVGRMLRRGNFDITRFQSILDIGSGAGQILGHLLDVVDPGTRLVACDLSPQMLRRARGRIKSTLPDYVAADMMHLPFRDQAFDCVTCGWVIEHLPDPKPGLRELGRVLRPGGSMLLLATEDTFSGAVVSRTWKCRTYNREELQAACADSGLPWHEELWFTPIHRFFKMGGILVEARKPLDETMEVAEPAVAASFSHN